MLAEAWAIDRSRTIVDTSARLPHWINDQLLKVGMEESKCLAQLKGGQRGAEFVSVADCRHQPKAIC